MQAGVQSKRKPSKIGVRFAKSRKAKKMSQKDVELKTGKLGKKVHFTSVSGLETGKVQRPTKETLKVLAEAVGITERYLATGVKSHAPHNSPEHMGKMRAVRKANLEKKKEQATEAPAELVVIADVSTAIELIENKALSLAEKAMELWDEVDGLKEALVVSKAKSMQELMKEAIIEKKRMK